MNEALKQVDVAAIREQIKQICWERTHGGPDRRPECFELARLIDWEAEAMHFTDWAEAEFAKLEKAKAKTKTKEQVEEAAPKPFFSDAVQPRVADKGEEQPEPEVEPEPVERREALRGLPTVRRRPLVGSEPAEVKVETKGKTVGEILEEKIPAYAEAMERNREATWDSYVKAKEAKQIKEAIKEKEEPQALKRRIEGLEEELSAKNKAEEDKRKKEEEEKLNRSLSVLDPKAPLDNARKLITVRYWNKEAGTATLKFWQEQFWWWSADHWRKLVSPNTVRKEIYEFLDKAVKEPKPGMSVRYEPGTHDVNQVIDALKAVADLEADQGMPGWFGEQPVDDLTELVAVQNGLVYLPTRELRLHTPRFWSPNVLEFKYEEGAKAPRFEQFLEELWPGDRGAQEALKQMFGLCMTDVTKYQKAFMFVGPKRGGRGTLGRVLAGLIGPENCASATFRQLAAEFGLESLIAKKVALFPDARLDGIRRDVMSVITERVLSITGEDTVAVNRKGIKYWNGKLGTRLVTFSNELLSFQDDSGAIASRFIIWMMQQSFWGREDLELTGKLLAERPGIMNLCLDALDRLRATGRFDQPRSGDELVERLGGLTSNVAEFVAQLCVVGPEQEVYVEKLFQTWDLWCCSRGVRMGWGSNQFSEKICAYVPTIRKSRPRKDNPQRLTMLVGIGVR
jgi:putative DNA primase/helicase